MAEIGETVREDEADPSEDTEAHGAGLSWNENVTVVEDDEDPAEDTEAHGAALRWNENVTVVEDDNEDDAEADG
jgi:hypothetical protein